jgi:spoIIIJ-associated protein
MENYLEMTGRTEELAIEAALQKLGLDRDDVSVEVLERPRSGFLGIGGAPAKVKITYQAPDEPVAPAPTPVWKEERPQPKAAPVRAERPAPVQTVTPVAEGDERAAGITAFLTGLMAQRGVEAAPRVALGEENTYEVELAGQNLGALIGRRGDTLDAIQQLTNYSVNRGYAKRVRVHVDAEHYRAKREESLMRLAEKVAGKVVKYRRNVTLEPMNAYERHVIHTALQEYRGVTTYSTGTEPNRRTVVAYSQGERR